jgi:nucleotide-binding universal stress UspA family protein
MFRKVLVGVDGHRGGHDAVALAKQLVADDGKLVLVHVYPVRGDPLHKDYVDYEAAQYVHARDVLEAASDEAGVDAELRRSALRGGDRTGGLRRASDADPKDRGRLRRISGERARDRGGDGARV